MKSDYVHGYTQREKARLADQAATLTDLLHSDTFYPEGCTVLEPGCGVGAQTVILARNSPNARFISVDISEDSLKAAGQKIKEAGVDNVSFFRGDIFNLPFQPRKFDHVFVCFLLEHLPNPVGALRELKKILKAGGTITVVEGDHGSTFFHPESPCARRTIQCLVEVQEKMGGNSEIGRQLYPLMAEAGFHNITVSPRMVYVDASMPVLVEGFTKNTFIAMVEGVREQALQMGLIDRSTWDQGIADLHRTTREDGTFLYTFFKCEAVN